MKADRLQLTLIPNLRPMAQPLPPHAKAKCIELIARMLPVEFETSETEEAREMEAALRVVDAMSPEELRKMVREDEPVRSSSPAQ